VSCCYRGGNTGRQTGGSGSFDNTLKVWDEQEFSSRRKLFCVEEKVRRFSTAPK
jgi:hypothetical protein